jgi:hypothetical protein
MLSRTARWSCLIERITPLRESARRRAIYRGRAARPSHQQGYAPGVLRLLDQYAASGVTRPAIALA